MQARFLELHCSSMCRKFLGNPQFKEFFWFSPTRGLAFSFFPPPTDQLTGDIQRLYNSILFYVQCVTCFFVFNLRDGCFSYLLNLGIICVSYPFNKKKNQILLRKNVKIVITVQGVPRLLPSRVAGLSCGDPVTPKGSSGLGRWMNGWIWS